MVRTSIPWARTALPAQVINLGANATVVPITVAIGGGGAPARHERYTLTAWPDAADMQANVAAGESII
jgi:hypothetical protein